MGGFKARWTLSWGEEVREGGVVVVGRVWATYPHLNSLPVTAGLLVWLGGELLRMLVAVVVGELVAFWWELRQTVVGGEGGCGHLGEHSTVLCSAVSAYTVSWVCFL